MSGRILRICGRESFSHLYANLLTGTDLAF